MPTVTKSISKFDLSSTDKGSWATVGSQVWSLDLAASGVLEGSTVTAATLDIYMDVSKSSSTAYLYLGSSSEGNSRRLAITNARSATYDILALFNGITTSAATESLLFTYQVEAGYGSGTAHVQGFNNRSTLVLTLTYTLPYTACTPPSTVVASSTNVAPGAAVSLSWSGASAGTNNPIASYSLWGSTDGINWAVVQSGITGASTNITAPTTNGATYYYAVQSIGSVAGYNSARSSAYASVTCAFSAPSVSGVTIDGGAVTVYKKTGTTATLAWTGANGTNNPIAKYQVYRGSTLIGEPTTNSLSVDAPPAGNQYSFTITPIGTYSNGSAVTSPTIYGYSDPTAPTSVVLAKTEAGKSENVTLSWSGAVAGTGNPTVGYKLYRATSLNGSYAQQGGVITGTSTTVVSPPSNNSYYYYRIVTVGTYSESAQSEAYARIRSIWTAPTTTSISLSANVVAPSASVALNFAVAAGTNNPVASIEVYRGNDKIATLGASATSYNVSSGANAGDELAFKIKPVGVEAEPASSYSSEVSLKSYGPVTAPSSVSVSNTTPDAGTNVTLSWSGATAGAFNNIVSYQVYRSTSASGTYNLLSTQTGTSVSVKAPTDMGSRYYYKIKTVGEYSTSGYSGYASVTSKVYTVPSAPVISVSPTSATVYDPNPVLSWGAVADGTNNPVTGYRVYRSTSETGTYEQLGDDLAKTALSIGVSVNPTAEASYFYKVYTIGTKAGYNVSAPSNVVRLITSAIVRCGVPKNFSVNTNLVNAGDSIVLSWDASDPGTNNSVKRYIVWRDRGDGWALLGYALPSDSQILYMDFAGSAGTVQRYRVMAESDVSSTFSSDWTNVLSVTSNSPPTAISKLVEPPLKVFETNPIRLSWQAGTDINGNLNNYEISMRTRVSSSAVWSAWEYLSHSATTTANLLPSLDRGEQCQFRIRSVDSLGLTSAWVQTSVYTRDVIPSAPTILLPNDGAITFDAQPYMVVNANLLPSLNTNILEISVDNGAWVQVMPIAPVTNGYAIRCPDKLASGALHFIQLRVKDSLGVISSVVSVHIRRSALVWDRSINRGTIISEPGASAFDDETITITGSFDGETVNATNGSWSGETLTLSGEGGISHQAEIVQLYLCVNIGLTYYNLTPITVPGAVGEDYSNAYPGKIGMFASWGDQMLDLYNALKLMYVMQGVKAPVISITSGMAPTAKIISTLRTMIENM